MHRANVIGCHTLRSLFVNTSNRIECCYLFFTYLRAFRSFVRLFLLLLFAEPICSIFQRNHHGYAMVLILCPLLKLSNAFDGTPKKTKEKQKTRQKLMWIKESAAYLSSMQCNTAEFSKWMPVCVSVCADALNSFEFRCHSNSISISLSFLLLFVLMFVLNFIVCCCYVLCAPSTFNRISFFLKFSRKIYCKNLKWTVHVSDFLFEYLCIFRVCVCV